MEININIDKESWKAFDKFISNPEFVHYLTSNTTDVAVVALILQTLIEKSEELKKFFNKEKQDEYTNSM